MVPGSSRRRRYLLIASLYVSQAIPLGFFVVAVPAILRREGASLENVGLVSALALPWLIKFLWAPLLDRFGSARLGHYRSWILPLQALSVATVILIASLDARADFGLLLVAGAAFMLLSATQDIATDGLAVRTLAVAERGTGNGIQVGGYYLGQILGGGVMLVALGRFGWTTALLAMAAFLALPLWPVLRFRERAGPRPDAPRLDYGALGRFFTRSGAAVWVPLVVLFRAGETMAVAMLNPMLVDHGHSLEQIGLVLGVGGSLAAMAGALLGGWGTTQLGRKRSLVVFATLQAAGILAFTRLATGTPSLATIYAVSAAVAFLGGMATASLYTNMMDRSARATAATDFTLQQSLAAIGPVIGASLSGFSASALGYAGHFTLCAAIGLGCAVLAAWGLAPVKPEPSLAEREPA